SGSWQVHPAIAAGIAVTRPQVTVDLGVFHGVGFQTPLERSADAFPDLPLQGDAGSATHVVRGA
ncbi:MAG TPA: hypothetical protein VGF71_18945, partial [Caulobacteraceae bacterium]